MNSKDNFQRLVQKAKELGIEVKEIFPEKRIVALEKEGKTRYLWGSSLPLNNVVGVRLAKYKNITKLILKKLGVSTPRGFLCKSPSQAKEKIKKGEINYPLVAKPNEAALGERVFVGIENEKELEMAIRIIQEKYHDFILEEVVKGDDFRILVLDGKIVAACKRIPPAVIGNGVSKLKNLIKKYNEKREKKVKIDEEVKRNLEKQGVNLNSIIPRGKKIILRRNANVFTGGMVEDVTEKIHPHFRDLAIKIVRELGLRVGGVDVITKDIFSWPVDYWVTEVNGLPSFDIHEKPDKGKKRDITGEILRAIFN